MTEKPLAPEAAALAAFFTLDKLKELCQGDPARLPTFVVHDNEGWSRGAMVDSKGRVHLNDKTFLQVIANHWPVKLLGRDSATSIHYALALERHHLEGGLDVAGVKLDRKKLRRLVGANPDTGKGQDD